MLSRQMFLSAMLVLLALLGLIDARALPDDSSVAMGRPSSTRTVRMSNAERFRRGLPPKAPRQLYTPTRVLAPRTSNTVTTVYYAEVAYTSDPSTVAGYLAMTSASGGYVAMVTTLSTADPYFAPANVPADNALLYTYSNILENHYYIFGSSGTTTTPFSGAGTTTAAGVNSWDFTDFDSNYHIGVTYVGSGSTPINLYVDPNNYRGLYAGPSAAAINSAYSTSIAETDKVTIALVLEEN